MIIFLVAALFYSPNLWQPGADGGSVVFEDVAEAFLIIRDGNASIERYGNLQTSILFPMHDTHWEVLFWMVCWVEVEDWWIVPMRIPNPLLAFLQKTLKSSKLIFFTWFLLPAPG